MSTGVSSTIGPSLLLFDDCPPHYNERNQSRPTKTIYYLQKSNDIAYILLGFSTKHSLGHGNKF